jgi:hypothetical protein
MFKDLPPCSFATNKERAGVELRFGRKPSKDVLDALKSDGWRWSRFAGAWYRKDTREARQSAARFLVETGAALLNAETAEAPAAPIVSADPPRDPRPGSPWSIDPAAPVALVAVPSAAPAPIVPPRPIVKPAAPVVANIKPDWAFGLAGSVPERAARPAPSAARRTAPKTAAAPAGLIGQLASMFPE